MQTAKKLLALMCLNHERTAGNSLLCDKIGNILKTHLDFIAWFQQVRPDVRKKAATFTDLIKLLHRQLPLNILGAHIDLGRVDYSEIVKVLRNTLTVDNIESAAGAVAASSPTPAAMKSAKWVRFVDEVNEKIMQIQETCLAIYNGFFCVNEALQAILYSCEHFNSKVFANLRHNSSTTAAAILAFKKSGSNLNESQVNPNENENQTRFISSFISMPLFRLIST